jgi:hypothetical protein
MPLTDIRSYLDTAFFVAVSLLSLFGICVLSGIEPASNPNYYELFFVYFLITVGVHALRFLRRLGNK